MELDNTRNLTYEQDDMDLETMETEGKNCFPCSILDSIIYFFKDERTCPDCGRVFLSSQNMRRHQNMFHIKKERRYQMAELPRLETLPAKMEVSNTTNDNTSPIRQEPEDTPDNNTPTDDVKNENPNTKNDTKSEAKPTIEKIEADEKKIQFAAGLKLIQKDPSSIDPLSKIELSYIEKCKAMVSMFHTLHCACHNVHHKTLRHLLSHLRETRIWFPLFTCYNCMISLTDRSTFTKHYTRCSRPKLEKLIKLSNVRKRSDVKSRLYQNFKCNKCKFLFSFHEDFCKHIDDDHADDSPPFYCSCRYIFDSVEEYKTHCYSSCMLSYYCDICFITTNTVEEFVKHCQELHDTSEGFLLLQDHQYVPRTSPIKHKEADDEANVVEGKRERRKSAKEPIMIQIYDKEIPPDLKDIPTSLVKKIVNLDSMRTASGGYTKAATCCPMCKKQYSNVNNMIRHYRSHIERGEVEIPRSEEENEDLYTCPDCGGVYPVSKWKQHVQEKHAMLQCNECDKEFQFKSELDQHRSVHLNLKVYRDSKTQAYKSAMVSPTAELNGSSDDVMPLCDLCDTMFLTKEELDVHKVQQHPTEKEETNSEVDVEEEEGNDSDYVPTPVNDKPFCEKCGSYFASQKTLREHTLNKHGQEYLKEPLKYPRKCDKCDKVCGTGAAYNGHLQWHIRQNMSEEEKAKSEYPKKCEYCDKMCSTPAGLYLHTQMHERVTLGELKKKKHDDPKVERSETPPLDNEDEESYHTCNRCFKVFGTKGKLKEHLKSHGIVSKSGNSKRNRKVLCNLCHMAFDSQTALTKHKAQEHNSKQNDDDDDDEDMEDDDSRQSDSSQQSSVIYGCDICDSTFATKEKLRHHKEKSHQIKIKRTENMYCKYCKIAFKTTSEFVKHMHVEHGESAKPKTVKSTKAVDPKPHKCTICKKAFSSTGALNTHFGWHKRLGNPAENTPQGDLEARATKKFKVLKKVAEADQIPKIEPDPIPEFQCTTCFMELPNNTALQIHILEKHRNLDALMLIPRCDTCNQDFESQEEYEKHKRFHAFLERQIKQETEEIQTPVIQSVHSVAESSKIRFHCNWCSSSFSRQDTLNTHIRTHHKEHVKTEFECHHCNRVFDKQNSLTVHLKVHQKQTKSTSVSTSSSSNGGSSSSMPVSSGSKIYICSLCNMGFNYPKDLRVHTINAHPF